LCIIKKFTEGRKMSLENIGELTEKINSEIKRLDVCGGPNEWAVGIKAKNSSAQIIIHDYQLIPWSVWVREPENLIAHLANISFLGERTLFGTRIGTVKEVIEGYGLQWELTVSDFLRFEQGN
jgi:hypothetical protein